MDVYRAIAVSVVAGLSVYILSIGPVTLWTHNKPSIHPYAREIYSPILWLYDNTPLHDAIGWYVDLWQD